MDTTAILNASAEPFDDTEAEIDTLRENVAKYLEWNKDGSQAVVQNMRIRDNGDRD